MGDWLDPEFSTQDIDAILESVAAYPQHTFLTLTKRYDGFAKLHGHTVDNPCRELSGGDYLLNLWLGLSITSETDLLAAIPHWQKMPIGFKRWISFEPLLGNITAQSLAQLTPPPNQIAIGAQTRPLVCPSVDSINEICDYADLKGIPVFLKDNIPEDVRHELDWEKHRKLAWEVRK